MSFHDEDLVENEQRYDDSMTTVSRSNKQRDLSFDMTETSDQSSTGSSSVRRSTGTTGKVLLLLTAVVALSCSIYTILSCKFLIVQDNRDSSSSSSPPPPSSSSFIAGNTLTNTTKSIGIFSYATQDYTNPLNFATYCLPYEYQFWESDLGPLFWSAQLSALLAPSVGGLALVIQLVEIMRRHFLQNFLLVVFLYLMASLIQAYTFAIYGAMDFCWKENEIQCKLSESGYASVAAAASYYLCILLLCCVPRPSIPMDSSKHGNNTVLSQDHMVPPPPQQQHTPSAANLSIMEEGQRSVRFEDPPVSQILE